MYLFQCVFITFCIVAVLCQHQIRIADAANYEKGSLMVNGKENVDDGDDDDDGQGINYEDFSDMYGTLNKKLTRLTDYAQGKVRRSTSDMLNNLIEKNANKLKQHLNTIQSTRSLKEMKQEKRDRHAAASSTLNSLRMEKVLNVLAPYYDNHEKKFVGNDVATNSNENDSTECDSLNENNNDKGMSSNGKSNGHRKIVTNTDSIENVLEKKFISPKRNSGKFEKFSAEKLKQNDDMFASLLAHSCEICPPEYATADYCCNKESPAKHKRQTFENPNDKRRTYDSKSFMSTTNQQPQYPDVVAKSSPHLGGYKLIADDNNNQAHSSAYVQPIQTDAKLPYSDFLNYYDQQRIQLARRDNNNNISLTATAATPIRISTEQSASNLTQTASTEVTADCAKYMDGTNNATAVLERVLEELELIRAEKNGSLHPEGAPCDIRGSWNSEIIGLRFDINETANGSHEPPPPAAAAAAHDLSITLFDHSPPRRNTLMDTNWTCSGNTLHNKGGPFYIYAAQKKEQVLATFTGICKTCGGVDTIFGTWSIVHPAKDCHDLQMSIETKRDIFRKEMLYVKKIQKLERLKSTNNSNNAAETNQPQQSETTSDQVPSSTTSTSSPIPEIRSARRYY